MFKKTFVLMMSLVFVLGLSGLVLAQNTVDIDQVGPINTATANQTGSGNDIDVIQEAGTSYNYAYISQVGVGNDVFAKQGASVSNDLNVTQTGNGNDLDLDQNSSPATNTASVSQSNGSIADIDQTAGSYNAATVTQGASQLYVDQDAGTTNDLDVTQDDSYADIDQDALGYNLADISQTIGNNLLEALQVTGGGFNSLTVDQRGGMTASVSQTAATGNNTAMVTQIPTP